MKKLIIKLFSFLAGKKSILAKRYNSKQETYCQMLRREKSEEEMRVQAAEKKKSGGFAY